METELGSERVPSAVKRVGPGRENDFALSIEWSGAVGGDGGGGGGGGAWTESLTCSQGLWRSCCAWEGLLEGGGGRALARACVRVTVGMVEGEVGTLYSHSGTGEPLEQQQQQ